LRKERERSKAEGIEKREKEGRQRGLRKEKRKVEGTEKKERKEKEGRKKKAIRRGRGKAPCLKQVHI
jgi:hypothetical protein